MVRVLLPLTLLLLPCCILLMAVALWFGRMRATTVLAFVCYQRHLDDYDICLVDVMTGVRQNVTHHIGQESDFTWSPDGNTIAFISNRENGPGLYRMRANGTHIEYIPAPSVPVMPRWSPQGNQIAFLGGRSRDVYVMPAEGGAARNLTLTPSQEVNFTWSPDGTYIAASYMDESRVMVVNVITGTPLSLIQDGHMPGWSPDSHQIAYRLWQKNAASIGIKALDNTRATDITTDTGQVAWYAPAWSPDGRTLVYLTVVSARYRLRLVDLSANITREIGTSFDAMGAPLWSPDGTLLAFSGRPPGGATGIYVLDVAGETLRMVSDSGMLPAWRPG